MTWKEAVCYGPAQFALAVIRDGQVRLDDGVTIFGLGPIGLISAQMANSAGASLVITLEPIETRRSMAMKIGTDIELDSMAVDVGFELTEATDTRANHMTLDQPIHELAFGGNILTSYLADGQKGAKEA